MSDGLGLMRRATPRHSQMKGPPVPAQVKVNPTVFGHQMALGWHSSGSADMHNWHW